MSFEPQHGGGEPPPPPLTEEEQAALEPFVGLPCGELDESCLAAARGNFASFRRMIRPNMLWGWWRGLRCRRLRTGAHSDAVPAVHLLEKQLSEGIRITGLRQVDYPQGKVD